MTEPATIRIEPFKAKRHRHQMPFKKGQGVTLAGWQFEVKSCQANGTLNLTCKGKVLDEMHVASGASGVAVPDPSRKPIPTTIEAQ